MQKLTSASDLPAQYLVRTDNLGSIHISGEEAAKYLQGQVTVDVNTITDSNGVIGCHCDFKGKTWNIFYASGTQQDITLICHKGAVPASLAELKKYGVFSKVEITENTDEYTFFAGAGEQIEAFIKSVFGRLPDGHLQTVQNNGGLVFALDAPIRRYVLMLSEAI